MTPTSRTTLETEAVRGLPPWQFFLLCGMLGATAVVVVATGQTLANIVILSFTVVAVSFVGLGAYHALSPLVMKAEAMSPTLIGGRTRAALEREKTLVLRSIKELEFDFAMAKLSQADFDEMGGRLRRRAIGLMRQLDAGSLYRDQIEREVAARLQDTAAATLSASSATSRFTSMPAVDLPVEAGPLSPDALCASCGTPNGAEARFCNQCGSQLLS